MGVIDTLLKASVIVVVAAVSTAVAYHYVIYIPQRDAALDDERRAETARATKSQAERELQAAMEKAEAEKRKTNEKAEAEERKLRVSARYEACNRNATANYSLNWNSNCARINQLERTSYSTRYSNCMSLSLPGTTKETCEASSKPTTKPEDCALPSALADSLNKDLAQAKDRCLREFQLGLD